MIDVLLDLMNTYLNLYQISLTASFIFLWVALSYVDRIHLRERARRIGLYVSTIIAYLLINAQFYDKFRIVVARPMCAIFETVAGFLEGVENFEATVLISENKDQYLIDADIDDDISGDDSDDISTIRSINNSFDSVLCTEDPMNDSAQDDYQCRKITTRYDPVTYHKMSHDDDVSKASLNVGLNLCSKSNTEISGLIVPISKNIVDAQKFNQGFLTTNHDEDTMNANVRDINECEINDTRGSDDEKSDDLCSGLQSRMPDERKIKSTRHRSISLSSGIKTKEVLSKDSLDDQTREQCIQADKNMQSANVSHETKYSNQAIAKVEETKERLSSSPSRSKKNNITLPDKHNNETDEHDSDSNDSDSNDSNSDDDHNVINTKIVAESLSKSRSQTKECSKSALKEPPDDESKNNKQTLQGNEESELRKRRKVPIRLVRHRHQN